MMKTMINEELSLKKAKIEEMQKQLEKQFGKGVVMGGNDKPKFHDFISTGSLGLDKALGIGGLPKGRIVEILGWESSGKTTIAIHTIAEAQKDPNSYCGYVDAEHSFDTKYAEQVGVDLERLKISQPDNGEQALEVAEKMCASGQFDVVVIDSVAALVPKAEVDREMGESSMGKHALLMSQAMRKLTPVVAKSGTLLIFINQKREKIGVMFGDASTTTGGNSLKFYASVRLDVTRSITNTNSVIEGEVKVGNLTKVKVIKNKMAPPFREASFNIRYGVGVDKYEELTDLALEMGLITKAGGHFSYMGTNIAHGRPKLVELLKEGGALYHELVQVVKESYEPKEFLPEPEKIEVKIKEDGI